MNVHGKIRVAAVERWSAFVASHRITEQVVKALEPAGLELGAVHQMDEFTLDLVVPLPEGLCLVYDTT